MLLIPGNHDVQWWWRPFLPWGTAAKYRKYVRYFGPDLTPTAVFPDAVLASVLTAHGLAWGSLTLRPRDLAVKGHLPRREVERVRRIFTGARPGQVRVLVVHHNVLPGELSQRMGLARWRQAQRRVVASGAELVLCGHDHQERVDVLGDGVVVSCAGTLSRRSRGGRPATVQRITIDDAAIEVQLYRWDPEGREFRRSDTHLFARRGGLDVAGAKPPRVVVARGG